MLTARDHKYNIRNKQKPNGTGMIAVRRVLFHCRVESFAFVLRVRPSVVAHALIIFGMRSVVAFQFGSNIVNTGCRSFLSHLNGVFFIALGSYFLNPSTILEA